MLTALREETLHFVGGVLLTIATIGNRSLEMMHSILHCLENPKKILLVQIIIPVAHDSRQTLHHLEALGNLDSSTLTIPCRSLETLRNTLPLGDRDSVGILNLVIALGVLVNLCHLSISYLLSCTYAVCIVLPDST